MGSIICVHVKKKKQKKQEKKQGDNIIKGMLAGISLPDFFSPPAEAANWDFLTHRGH